MSVESIDRDLELRLLNSYHLKGVKLSALENEERIAILGEIEIEIQPPAKFPQQMWPYLFSGNLLYAYDASWHISDLPILIGGTQIKLAQNDKEKIAEKKTKAEIRRWENRNGRYACSMHILIRLTFQLAKPLGCGLSRS